MDVVFEVEVDRVVKGAADDGVFLWEVNDCLAGVITGSFDLLLLLLELPLLVDDRVVFVSFVLLTMVRLLPLANARREDRVRILLVDVVDVVVHAPDAIGDIFNSLL